MSSDVGSYLATHYLVADSKPNKKRKRKHKTESSGLLINDDDDGDDWGKKKLADDDEGEGNMPILATSTSADFRKSKKSNWRTVADDALNSVDADSAAAADAVLAAAAADNAAARAEQDEAPVVADNGSTGNMQMMSDGTHAGLQTADAVAAQLEKRRREERKGYVEEEQAETTYRDATGRRIDVSMRRAEARRAAAEAEEKERLAKEALKGNAQVEAARRRREELEEAKLMPLARNADDEEMNRELKEQERWNDPMSRFLAKEDPGAGNIGKKGRRRPVYKGAAPPNRYGIRPGYRWDGVDRSNGFEAERFKALSRRERNRGLDYAWQMDE